MSASATLSHSDTFRAASPGRDRVDRANRIIVGVKVVELGDLSPVDNREYFVDRTTLEQVLALGIAAIGGVKSRTGHPSELADDMLQHLGRFKNFRIVGNAVVADLHVAASAKEGDYVLNLAAEDPSALGASMHALLDHDAMNKARGGRKLPIRVRYLNAIDLVGTPAATRGLLADKFAAVAADRPSTHLDAIADYMQNRAAYEAIGLTLLEYVVDYFLNNAEAPEPTDAILKAVAAESDRLQATKIGTPL